MNVELHPAPPDRTRLFVYALACSFVLLTVLVVRPPKPLLSAMTVYSDHYSHYMATIVAWHRGWDVWKKPIRDICTVRGRDQVDSAKIPPEYPASISSYVGNLPERKSRRPLVINWPELPRAYPPGVYLYMAPEALLYENTGISFQALNTLAILKFLAVVHLLLLLLAKALYGNFSRTGVRLSLPWMMTGMILLPLMYFLNVWWAMRGFYDGISMLFIVVAVTGMMRKEWNRALFCMSCAVFLHYRALWYLPLFLIIMWHGIRERSWRGGKIGTAACYLLSAVFIAAAAAGMFMLMPQLVRYEPSNALYMHISAGHAAAWIVKFAVRLGLILALTALLRSWRVLLIMLWQAFMIAQTPQAEPWHVLFLLPLFAVTRLDGAKFLQLAAVFLFFGLEAVALFHQIPFVHEVWGFFRCGFG